jgi:hypothetical protein
VYPEIEDGHCLPDLRAKWDRKRGIGVNAVPVATLVCLILLALLAVAQVAHLHATESDADHCPICIVMHSAAPVAVSAAAVVLIQVGFRTLPVEAPAVVRYWHSELYIRPPPNGIEG